MLLTPKNMNDFRCLFFDHNNERSTYCHDPWLYRWQVFYLPSLRVLLNDNPRSRNIEIWVGFTHRAIRYFNGSLFVYRLTFIDSRCRAADYDER